jgi:hypothetical protein
VDKSKGGGARARLAGFTVVRVGARRSRMRSTVGGAAARGGGRGCRRRACAGLCRWVSTRHWEIAGRCARGGGCGQGARRHRGRSQVLGRVVVRILRAWAVSTTCHVVLALVAAAVDPSPASWTQAGAWARCTYCARLGRISWDAGAGSDCNERIIIGCAGGEPLLGRGASGGVCGCCGTS